MSLVTEWKQQVSHPRYLTETFSITKKSAENNKVKDKRQKAEND